MSTDDDCVAPTDCSLCDRIWQGFANPGPGCTVNFGTFASALSSPCSKHTPLLKAFLKHCYGNHEDPWHHDDVAFGRSSTEQSAMMTESLSRGGCLWYILLQSRPEILNHPGTGRILDPDWIDLDMVIRWKTECLSVHGSKCENPLKTTHVNPAWLVDIVNYCIVGGEGCGSYTALSYRWGTSSGFAVDETLLSSLQQPHALQDPKIWDRLPPTIRHAIYLTSMIGERYIWIDALCIIHGEHPDTEQQLNLMGATYASAVLTIVAADGDSSDGLLGIRDVSTTRNLKQNVIPFGDEKIIVRNTNLMSLASGTEYYERAWTYQEHCMSARKLFFNKKEIHWECQCSIWHEELTFGTEIDKPSSSLPLVILSGFPDTGSLDSVLREYNERKLTYDEDALSGVAGYLSIMSRTFHGGFLYGCPQMFFDRALGWKPMWPNENLRRRIRSNARKTLRLSSSSALPSWSWLGWEGSIDLNFGEALRIEHPTHRLEETIPITDWHTGEQPDDEPVLREQIWPTWYHDRKTYKDSTQSLPDGWTRHKAPSTESSADELYLYPDGCGEYVFKHRNLSNGEDDTWHYPFPVADIQESTPFETPVQTPYLFAIVNRAFVWSERFAKDGLNSDERGNVLRLRAGENNGATVGKLYLHNKEQLNIWPRIDNLQTTDTDVEAEAGCETVTKAGGTIIELVAIYRSVVYNKTLNEATKKYGEPLKQEESYGVLWIGWQEKVAYRLASGYVHRDAWEALELEEIDLVLG